MLKMLRMQLFIRWKQLLGGLSLLIGAIGLLHMPAEADSSLRCRGHIVSVGADKAQVEEKLWRAGSGIAMGGRT